MGNFSMNPKLSHPGKSNGNYKDGRYLKPYYCSCGKQIAIQTALYRSGKCISCSQKIASLKRGKPINCTTQGRTKNYCCKDCGNLICPTNALHKSGCCKKCIKKYYRSFKGKNNPNYKNGKTSYIRKLRNSKKFKEWRNKVFTRDNYISQNCFKSGDMVAHHLNGFHWCKELRFDINNGITLCIECHKSFHLIFGKFWNNINQYIEFITYENT